MKLSKPQFYLIMTLNLIIVLLLGGLFLIPQSPFLPSSNIPTVPYEAYRNARTSLNPAVDWENNFGGSGSDTFSDCFFVAGKNYIFGNTASSDYDFKDFGGVCLIIADATGKAEKYVSIGERGDTLVGVTLSASGFALAVNAAKPFLLNVNLEGVTSNPIYPLSLETLRFADLKLLDNQIVLAAYSRDDYVDKDKLTIFVYDTSLKYRYSSVLDTLYSREYLTMYVSNKSIIVVTNLIHSLLHCMSFSVVNGGTPLEYRADEIPPYSALYAMPYNGSVYALIKDETGTPKILILDKNFISVTVQLLNNIPYDDGFMFAFEGNFFIFNFGKNSSRLYVYDTAFRLLKSFENLTSNQIHYVLTFNNQVTFLCGGASTSIMSFDKALEKKETRIDVSSDKMKAVKTANGIFLAGDVKSKTADAGGNFGKSDIWLSKINTDYSLLN